MAKNKQRLARTAVKIVHSRQNWIIEMKENKKIYGDFQV